MAKSRSSQRIAILGAILIALVIVLVARRVWERDPELITGTAEEADTTWRTVGKRKLRRAPEAIQSPLCDPHASERCERGDVWSVDSCGVLEEKLEECGARICQDGACITSRASGCEGPPEGRCNGDVVELCLVGHPLSIDCAAQGMRCKQGLEGASCAPQIPEAERCEGADRCIGDVLTRCLEGRQQLTDCAAIHGHCAELPGEQTLACIVPPPVVVLPACGPCGCGVDTGVAETTCDGRDEDGDGHIDEGLDCGPVPLVAYRITGLRDETMTTPEDIDFELMRINRAFASGEHPGALQFKLAEIVDVRAPELQSLDEGVFVKLADDPRFHVPRSEFHVPIVFADNVLATGGVPKPGMSTLPNGTCGGVQESRGPQVGLIAVARARYPTTVAHEIGHFLGLCHTHDQQRATAFIAYQDARLGLQTCQPSCRGEGDGICDTPVDPGPGACGYDQTCSVACATGARPDANNLMSYYADCREGFSSEQMTLMQHTLALRRGWQRCLNGACACRTASSEDCPASMACRSATIAGELTTRCILEGPRMAGEECRGGDDCNRGSVCVSRAGVAKSRCARVCTAMAEGCNCSATEDGSRVCLEDLGT